MTAYFAVMIPARSCPAPLAPVGIEINVGRAVVSLRERGRVQDGGQRAGSARARSSDYMPALLMPGRRRQDNSFSNRE